MKWLERLRRARKPSNRELARRVPSLDTPGWTLVEQDDRMILWQDNDGDALSLASNPDSGMLQLPDENAVRQAARELAEGVSSGLVEAAVVPACHGPAVMLIYKRRDGTAFVFTGMLFVPAARYAWLWTLVALERGTTGVREAVVTAKLMEEGELTIETYKTSWAQDPYDPAYHGVDRSTLRYLSDDEAYDSLFPQHPLSKVRRELRRLLSMQLDTPDRDELI